ncbi:glycine zipper 2TM domain-containing protein [Propionivibrio sp.]|uniref:glycine zipper 2TM domain-containing protein n=1 Tax=Propionivibrio sp. TaxID=2212460 RepID=UPI00262FB581|nr:glycine zipper 2TM domain-containing protein [Propionivibrio sp.]
MKKQLGITLTLAACLLSSTVAMADDAVWGALLGGGAGAIAGRSIGGRDGTIIGGVLGAAAGAAIGSERGRSRVEYSAPPVYYAQPARFAQRPIYYVQGRYERDDRRRHEHRHHDWNERH